MDTNHNNSKDIAKPRIFSGWTYRQTNWRIQTKNFLFPVQPKSNLYSKFQGSRSYRSQDIVLTRNCFESTVWWTDVHTNGLTDLHQKFCVTSLPYYWFTYPFHDRIMKVKIRHPGYFLNLEDLIFSRRFRVKFSEKATEFDEHLVQTML